MHYRLPTTMYVPAVRRRVQRRERSVARLRFHAAFFEQFRLADYDPHAAHRGFDAFSRHVLGMFARRRFVAARRIIRGDRLRDGVGESAFRRRHEREVFFGQRALDDGELSFGYRARLVERRHCRVHIRREHVRALDEHAGLRRAADAAEELSLILLLLDNQF